MSPGRLNRILLVLIAWVGPATGQTDPLEVFERFGDGPAARHELPGFGERFELLDGELVVFAGQTNLVREEKSGLLEALLTAAWSARNTRFRSMAWEGDTVYEQRRDLEFGSWSAQLEWAGATVVAAQFGQVEAMDGAARLPEFTAAYSRLLDEFAAVTPRLVLLSPIPFEKPMQAEAPDLRTHNESIRRYTDAIDALARQRQAVFVDLFNPVLERMQAGERLTSNGMHLEERGLDIVARITAEQLGFRGVEISGLQSLREAVVEKNRLWFDCWRPMNWAFAFGDRQTQLFGQPIGGRLWLKDELEAFKPLLAEQDRRIAQLARGEQAPDADGQAARPKPPDPESGEKAPPAEEMARSFTMGYGLEANLFAGEEQGVVNPIQIAWDAEGSLYVACSPTYPHIEPGAKPGDYILVCSDEDGDGRADQSRRFAEGLSMVQGVEPGAGGLWVCAGTELLHLRDADGDGKADQHEVVLSGFGTGDAHQLINSIAYGPDGCLWFTQGLHILSRVETPWGIASLERSGVWRYRPRSARLDGFFQNATAGHNCWGVAFDAFGQPFHKSGDRPHGYYSLPGLMRVADPAEYHPTGALFDAPVKTTAIDWIETGAMPEELQGCAVLGGFMGGTVDAYRVEDDGAGFRSVRLPELMRSSSEWFRPVDVSVGPDGGLYVCDFQNPVIGHYQTSYRDPRRDHHHGRIWRLSERAREVPPRPVLTGLNAAQLLERLASRERWTREHARKLLFDLPSEDVLAAADALLNGVASEADSEARTRLLVDLAGVYYAHGAVRELLVDAALRSDDARLRCAGIRSAGVWSASLTGAGERLLAGARDAHPRVRLEALIGSLESPGEHTLAVLREVWSRPRDRFLDYALVNAARASRSLWRGEAAGRPDNFNEEFLAFLDKAAGAAAEPPPRGQQVYATLCLNCHQPGGEGLAHVYPPLRGSERLAGPAEPLVRILMHGLQGPLPVGTQVFNGFMPASGLSDEDLAAVLSWVRQEFASGAEPVTSDEVERIREAIGKRESPWTLDELAP